MSQSNRLLRPAFIVALLTSTAPCFAQEQSIHVGPQPDWIAEVEPLAVPDDARGMVFLRRQSTQVHLTDDGQESFVLTHVRLLHPNALQLGNIGLTWNPAAGSPVVHQLRIYRDGEQINVLDQTEFEILRREDQLEAARLDGLLTATQRVPDLRVGDDLEIAYTIPTANPTLRDRDFGMLLLADSPAPGRVQLRLSWDEEDDAPRTRLTGDLEDYVSREDRAIAINVDSASPLTPPRDAPPRYSWQRIFEFSDFADWNAVSTRFDILFDEARAVGGSSPVAEEAARIARNHETDRARVQAALDLVTQQVRYIYVGLNTGAFTPASAKETWERRYGDCKGKTALLLALLDELEIPAEAVLVNNAGMDDAFEKLLPSPAIFDHVLVRAEIDGEDYWLDGTMPAMAIPTSRPVLPYRWVLPLRDGGTGLEEIVWRPRAAPDDLVIYEIDAGAGFDMPATITQTSITRGPEAIGQYVSFSALTDQQIETAFRNQMGGSTFWDTVDEVEWSFDREQQASVLKIVGTGSPDWESRSDGTMDLVLPGGGFTPPGRRQRDSGQDQNAPYWNEDGWSCRVTTVRIPTGTKPTQWDFNSAFDTQLYGRVYRRMFDLRDRSIRMIRLSRAEHREIAPDLAARDNQRLPDFDNSMARITHDSELNNRQRQNIAVPASYDVDWLNDYSACDPDFGYD